MSMSVLLEFAVPLMNKPLGLVPAKYVPAHCAIVGLNMFLTARTGELMLVSTASRCKMPNRY